MTCSIVLQRLPFPIQLKMFWMQQVSDALRVPFFGTIKRFRNDLSPSINEGSCIFFRLEILHNAMLFRYVVPWIHRALYVSHVIFHNQSIALSITWNTRDIHAALPKPTFSDVFTLTGKRFVGIGAVRMCATIHFTKGLGWWCVDNYTFKKLWSSDFAHVDTISGSTTYRIE